MRLIFCCVSLVFSLVLFKCVYSETESFDPYKVLDVRKNSSPDDIRKKYKKLAREWHPDKNKDADAGDKFTQINRAYEILGDEKKREQYDRFGKVDESDYQGMPRGQFFRTPFGDFHFPFEDSHINQAERITERFLENIVIPQSYERPFFFFATTDFCFHCLRVQPIWNKLCEELKSIEIKYGIVDVDYDVNVARKLRVPRIPTIGAVVEGRSIIFEAGEYSIKNLRDFTRKLFKDNLFVTPTPNVDTIDDFLSDWKSNKVKALFFGLKFQPSVRLLVAISQLTHFYSVVYIDISSKEHMSLIARFDVPTHSESLILFHESSEPTQLLNADKNKRFTTSELISTFKAHKYLKLPRLNRPSTYDELCPVKPNIKHCVILSFHSSLFDETEVNEFREFATKNAHLVNVKFLYIFTDVQPNVVDVWKRPSGDFKIALISRRQGYEVLYNWIDWCLDTCYHRLNLVTYKLENGVYEFPKINFKRYDIRDEYEGGIAARVWKRLVDWWDYFTYTYFDGDHAMTVMSILSTFVCLLIMTFLINIIGNQSVSQKEQEKFLAQSPYKAAQAAYRQNPSSADRFVVYDLRSYNYEKLIQDAPAGYRLILLLVDTDSKPQYLRRFADLCVPFSRTPYLLFGFCYIDKYITWYQRLLYQTVGSKDSIRNINVNHCVGTVLAINGYRKYYNIYHPKTISSKSNGGEFIGFDDDSSESEHEDINGHTLNSNVNGESLDGDSMLAHGRLLDGLGTWIDRLFDGSLPKCKIDKWPTFPVDAEEMSSATDKKLN